MASEIFCLGINHQRPVLSSGWPLPHAQTRAPRLSACLGWRQVGILPASKGCRGFEILAFLSLKPTAREMNQGIVGCGVGQHLSPGS